MHRMKAVVALDAPVTLFYHETPRLNLIFSLPEVVLVTNIGAVAASSISGVTNAVVVRARKRMAPIRRNLWEGSLCLPRAISPPEAPATCQSQKRDRHIEPGDGRMVAVPSKLGIARRPEEQQGHLQQSLPGATKPAECDTLEFCFRNYRSQSVQVPTI